jgi:hypothetical protein
LPDVAHEAFGYAATGHLDAQGLGSGETARGLEKAVADPSGGKTKKNAIQIHLYAFEG